MDEPSPKFEPKEPVYKRLGEYAPKDCTICRTITDYLDDMFTTAQAAAVDDSIEAHLSPEALTSAVEEQFRHCAAATLIYVIGEVLARGGLPDLVAFLQHGLRKHGIDCQFAAVKANGKPEVTH